MYNCTIANRKITYDLVITVIRNNGLLSNCGADENITERMCLALICQLIKLWLWPNNEPLKANHA